MTGPSESEYRTVGLLCGIVLTITSCIGATEPPWSPPTAEIYAATHIGGIVRSLDGGANWLPLGADSHAIMAYRKSLALGADKEIYVATSGGGFYVLEGERQPYRQRNLGLTLPNIRCISFIPETRVLWVGTWGAGVFASTDCGTRWNSENDGLTAYHINCLVVDPRDPEALWCGTTAGLFRMADDGRWVEVPALSGRDVRSLLVWPNDPTRVYAGMGWAGGSSHFLVSEDGGENWGPDDAGLPHSTVFYLSCDENGEILLAGTTKGVFTKKAGRRRWARLGINLPEVRVFAVTVLEDYFFAATEHGLFGIPPGGKRWRLLSRALKPSAVTDVVIRPLPAAPES